MGLSHLVTYFRGSSLQLDRLGAERTAGLYPDYGRVGLQLLREGFPNETDRRTAALTHDLVKSGIIAPCPKSVDWRGKVILGCEQRRRGACRD